jgi:prenyltransferase beta subunit
MIAPGDFCDPENDVTGLAVQVLTAAGGADAAVDRAHDALVAAQQTDGGFLPATGAAASDTATTAFDAEALTTLGVTAGATAATSFIAARQQDDGGFAIDANTPGSDLYAASDALPALVGATLTTLSHPITGGGPTSPPPTPTPTPTTTPTVTPTPTATPTSTPTLPPGGPNLTTGTRYLVAPSNLIDGHYYQLFPGFADFGLTIDGAYSLAATGLDDSALAKIVAFLNTRGKDGSDRTVDDWTGIGTPFVSGGSLGKEALLAEVVGANPRAFGGHDLIAALDASICGAATGGTDLSCAGSGNYVYAQSTFSQALGIMAQIRAGDAAAAASPIAYLESLQHHDGSFPSLIPSTGDSDVDSTAMAVMALDLVPGERAAMAVDKGIAWIATQQEADGGFPGAAGDSVNSAALAIQGLSVQAGGFPRQIAAALGFLAGLQNSDGGFNVAADGQPGSDVRASTQAIGGAVGTSFGTLSRDLSGLPTPPPTQSPTQKPTHKPTQKPTKQPTPTRAPVGPTVTVTRTATVTTTVTPTATATATPTGAPTLAPLPAFGASGSPSATGATAVADASDNTKPMNRLWWVVFAVTFALAALVAGLFLRRRRIYPSRPGAKHAGAATKAGS